MLVELIKNKYRYKRMKAVEKIDIKSNRKILSLKMCFKKCSCTLCGMQIFK